MPNIVLKERKNAIITKIAGSSDNHLCSTKGKDYWESRKITHSCPVFLRPFFPDGEGW